MGSEGFLTPLARCTCTQGWRCPWQSRRRRRWTWTWCRDTRLHPGWTRTFLEEFYLDTYNGYIGCLDHTLTNGSTWTEASTWGFSRGTGVRKQDWQSRSTWGRTYSEEEPARPRCQWVWPPDWQKNIRNGKKSQDFKKRGLRGFEKSTLDKS